MAEIAPLRALRYADQSEPLGDLLCPPYDVTSDAERDRLYVLSPHNFVRVEHPKPGGDPYARAAADLATWRQRGVMKQDPAPALYVHDHEFVVAKTRLRRRGIHCALRLHAPISASAAAQRTRRNASFSRTSARSTTRASAFSRRTASSVTAMVHSIARSIGHSSARPSTPVRWATCSRGSSSCATAISC